MIAPRQTGPHVWRGADLARVPEEWTWTLDAAHVDELLAAADDDDDDDEEDDEGEESISVDDVAGLPRH